MNHNSLILGEQKQEKSTCHNSGISIMRCDKPLIELHRIQD